MEYERFLATKIPKARDVGIEPNAMPAHLSGDFEFQAAVTRFALRKGRAAAFLGTGLGKTSIQIEWCRQAAEASNGRALILTPLSVAKQIEREAHRFGYQARVIRENDDVASGINICNYDRLDKLDVRKFGAVSLDESSILKSFTGATTRKLIAAFADTRFKLCATATPAPNDHMELGQHAQFLGIMDSNEMLARWFISDQTEMGRYRLKGHAVDAFWDWMASWSRAASSPDDLGYDGSRFILPPLRIVRHKVSGDVRKPLDGLFAADVSATSMHAVKRQTADARSESAARLIHDTPGPWIVWVDSDYEADAVHAALPGCGEVRGSMTADTKQAAIDAFLDGSNRVLIGKASALGFGLNFQHCANMIHLGRSFSYEQWYQSVRRCWRFGQTQPVTDHLMVAEGEEQIGRVVDRKSAEHEQMQAAMARAMRRDRERASSTKHQYKPTHLGKLPTWLTSAV